MTKQTTNHIPPGYKLTELGVIPVDWEVKSIGDGLKVRHGKSQKDIQIADGKYPILATGGEIGRTNTYLYNKPSVLIGRKGTIDKPQFMDKPFWTVDTLFYTEIYENYDPKFMFYKIKFIDWYKYNEASGVPSLNARTIENVSMQYPKSKHEQILIATALSDIDTLIDELDALITKKQAIKQGTMQLLLTGKKRLPGFSGEWEMKKLGDSISIATGKKDVNEGSDDGIYPFFTCSKKISYSNTYSFEGKTILIAGNGEVGHLQRYNGKFEAYQRTYVLQNFSINEEFLRHQLSRGFKKSLGIGTIGSTIPYIKKENITEYYFLTPPTIQEQTAIASTISDIDIEIQSLQQKKEKYTQIKQGMMQQLLTGKIRLV